MCLDFFKESPNTAEPFEFCISSVSLLNVLTLCRLLLFSDFFCISLLKKKLAYVEFPRTNGVDSCISLSVGWLTRVWVSLSAEKGMEGSGSERGKEGAS